MLKKIGIVFNNVINKNKIFSFSKSLFKVINDICPAKLVILFLQLQIISNQIFTTILFYR